MKKERLEEIFKDVDFKIKDLDKELLFTYLGEYAFDIFIESEDFIVIDDGESYLYFKSPFTGSFYNLSVIEFMQNLKKLYNAKDYDEVIAIMTRVEIICDYVYDSLYKNLFKEKK